MSKPIAARGAFFVFEGLDRCGKTTQAAKLVETLQGLRKSRVQHFKFPDRTTPTGIILDRYLADGLQADSTAMHLLFAANRWEKRAEMERLLKDGVHLVVDRYSYSGVAYSAAKGLPHLSHEYCAAVETGLLAPDAVFYLKIDPEAASARGGYGEERYEDVKFQGRVRQELERVMGVAAHTIDASAAVEDVAAAVCEVALPLVSQCEAGERALRSLEWLSSPPNE